MYKKIKVALVFGTRPEAIKMCPLVNELKSRENFDVTTIVTAQHREMLDQVLELFNVKPDYDLNIMKPNQNLWSLTSDILLQTKDIFENEQFDIVLVHGDTTTAFAADDPLTVVNNLSDFIFSLIRAVGIILLGFGILQIGLSLKSHDPSQRANGMLTVAGGIVITFSKEILTLITG